MKLRALVLAAGLLWSISAFPQIGAFETGNNIFRICSDASDASKGFCNGYLAGVLDANALEVGKLACLQQNVEADQVRDIVMQFLTAHPETRHLAAAREVLVPLQKAFPCK
jgi:hypothetical protein